MKIRSKAGSDKKWPVQKNFREEKSKREASYERIRLPCYNAIALPKSEFKTVVVLGCGRGGTSAIAGSLHCLGVRMMDSPELNSEDREIVQTFQRERFPRGPMEISKLIQQRNSQFNLWGWKDPGADAYLESVLCFLRNPHIIFVLRNPLDVALSHVASKTGSVEQGMDHAIKKYYGIWEMAKKISCPTLLVGYERTISARKELIGKVVEFLDISPAKTQVSSAVAFLDPKGGYRMPEKA